MKNHLSWRNILRIFVAALLIATLPSSLKRALHTRDPYLFTRQFFKDLVERLSGPGRLRFIVQPVVATLLGIRDGRRDARAESPPFVWSLLFHGTDRRNLLRNALASTSDLIAMAILFDMISQLLIFGKVYTAAALLVGPVLIAVPYSVSRAAANRLTGAKGRNRTGSSES
jgi:hypothetical protein